MKDYKVLAVRYLKQNKNRSIITILGTTLTVMILYSLLNIGWGYLLQTRQDMRETQDYEFVLFTETEEQITDILSDSRVKSAYVEQYYSYYNGIGTMYENALYINTYNPYKLDSIYEQLCATYGVDGDIHNELAWTYLQGSDGSFAVVVIYFSILVAFIFAIIGVGIIRNSIQLCLFENIRDYGNLRCIGSSKRQLKGIIFLQGMMLEVIGIALGAVLGTTVTIGLSAYFRTIDFIRFQGGFHLLPAVLILAVFLVDLYFAMGENAKLVTKMTPVSAIRGEYRIRKERFRLREKNIFRILVSKLFGIDGDYAFKSLMRNPGRFWRTVGAFVFGMAAFMVIIGIYSSFQTELKQEMDSYNYYQVYLNNTLDVRENISQVESSFPSYDMLQELSDIKEITEVKRGYSAIGYVTTLEELYDHYAEEYMATINGEIARNGYQNVKNCIENSGSQKEYPVLDDVIGVTCYGYDEADLARCQPVLMDGTLELSENGIVLVNQIRASVPNESEYMSYGSEYIEVPTILMDYQVGDTINIVDIGKMHEQLDSELIELNEKYWEMYEKVLAENPEDEQSLYLILDEYNQKKHQLVFECWQNLVEEGCFKTYVIEGMVEEDLNYLDYYSTDEVRILMSQDAYFELTGMNETQPTGFFYHLDRLPKSQKISRIFYSNDDMFGTEYEFYTTYCDVSWFVYSIEDFQITYNWILGISLVVLFIFTMSLLNIINATSSNLHLRRREFAQLRVIGVSKKRLMKITMLEGIITALTADLIGMAIGGGVGYGIFSVVQILYGTNYHFPYGVAIFGIAVSLLVLCGAIYVPLKNLNNDIVENLKEGSD